MKDLCVQGVVELNPNNVLAQKKAPNLVRLGAFDNPAVTYSPTGATLQYHRRNAVSLLCSEWEQVVPTRYRRRKTYPAGASAHRMSSLDN